VNGSGKVDHMAKDLADFVKDLKYKTIESHLVYIHSSLTPEIMVYEKTWAVYEYFNSFFVIGRLKKASQHKTKGEKNFGKNSDDLFTIDFFGVVFFGFG